MRVMAMPKITISTKFHGDAAERRREGRPEAENKADQVHDPRRVLAGEEIAHDGAGDRRADRAADALQEARRDQQFDRGREQGQHAGDQIDRHEPHDHRLAPEPVGERAADQLRQRKAGKVKRQGQLHHGVGGAECMNDFRHRRGEQRHRHRADGDQQRPEDADLALAHDGCARGLFRLKGHAFVLPLAHSGRISIRRERISRKACRTASRRAGSIVSDISMRS